jgi:hypothetical protein
MEKILDYYLCSNDSLIMNEPNKEVPKPGLALKSAQHLVEFLKF